MVLINAAAAILLILGLSVLVGARITAIARLERSLLGCLMVGYLFLSACLNLAAIAHLFHVLFAPILLVAALASRGSYLVLRGVGRRELVEALAVVLVGMLATAWLLGPTVVNALDVMRHGGILRAHIDLFFHGATVSQFAQSWTDGVTDILAAGLDTRFYHYGLYALPAIVAKVTGVNGTVLLLLFALPLGCLILFLALYQLASTLLPRRLAACVIVAASAMVLFDPSRDLALQNHLFDKSGLLSASPGASYGAAVLVWALAQLIRHRGSFWIFLIVLGLATFFLLAVRANYLPLLWVTMALLKARELLDPVLRRSWQPVLLIGAAALGAVLAAPAHRVLFGTAPAVEDVYTFMQSFIEPVGLRDPGGGINGAVRSAAVSLYALGPSLMALVILVWMTRSRRGRAGSDRIREVLFAVLVGYFGVIAISWTPSNGDPTELIQRPFVAINALVVALCLCLLWRAHRGGVVIAMLSLALVVHTGTGHNPGGRRPMGFSIDHPWHVNSNKLEVGLSLIELSRFLRERGAREAYAFVPIRKDSFGFFPEGIVTAVSEMPAFVSRPGSYRRVLRGSAGHDFERRLSLIDALARCEGEIRALEERKAVLRYIISSTPITCMRDIGGSGPYRVYLLPDPRPAY